MSAQTDRMRVAATELQAAVRRPWTGGMVDLADEVAGLLRSGADAADRVVSAGVTAQL